MIEILFWMSLILILYTYFGYPLVLKILSLFFSRPVKKESITPNVSFIIAAYNEEKAIKNKLENTLSLDYPEDKMEIIVVSDCSGDRTNEIVRSFDNKRIKLIVLEKRGGKTTAQNMGVKASTGDILVFSDASTEYKINTITKLVRVFIDRKVGCVGGKLIFKKDLNNNRKNNEGMFYSFKKIYVTFIQSLKISESAIYSSFGVDGCIYAVRKELCPALKSFLTSDFVVPLKIIEKGYRVIYEPEAIGYEVIAVSSKMEFNRKVRTVKAGIIGLVEMYKLLFNFKNIFIPFGLISHKLLKWINPLFLLVLFFSNLACVFCFRSEFYGYVLILQLMFYFCGFLGIMFKNFKYFKICSYFILYNVAAFVGLCKFIFEKPSEIWETER